MIVAWITAKLGKVGFEAAMIGLVALLIIGGCFAAYRVVMDTETTLQHAASEAATAKIAKDVAEATAAETRRQADEQAHKLEQLEQARALAQAELNERRAAGAKQTSTIDKDFDHDADQTVARLRARGAELNRVLERSSHHAR